jgi:tetratricopeptide (TPR) repeat protein
MILFSRFIAAAGLGVVLLIQARPTEAAVIVMNGGLAQTCYEMTRAISKGEEVAPSIQLTGSLIALSAVDICSLALEANDLVGRDRAGTYNNRGVLYFSKAMFTQAVADFEDARRIDPNIAEVHVNHGASMIALKRWTEGIASLNKGIDLEPVEPEKAYYNRAIAYEELGNVRGAYFDYLKASELKPEWEQPKMQLTRFTVRKTGETAK